MAILAFSLPSAFADFKVGLVLDRGGKDDKSFNASAYEGAMKAKKEQGIFLKYVEASDDNAFEPLLRAFAQKDFDLIIGIGFAQKEAIKKIAAQFPEKHFAIVDAQVDAPNVRSLLFEEHEGAYIIGAIAALTSKTGKVGFVGGMRGPLIGKFEAGYEAGVKAVCPACVVHAAYIGTTPDAYRDPARAKALGIAQIGAGADVLYHASGASGHGVFEAAHDAGILAIGVDSDQYAEMPGTVLTSMIKRADVAVFDAIRAVGEGRFEPGMHVFGVKDGAIDYVREGPHAELLSPKIVARVEGLRADIAAGRVRVPAD